MAARDYALMIVRSVFESSAYFFHQYTYISMILLCGYGFRILKISKVVNKKSRTTYQAATMVGAVIMAMSKNMEIKAIATIAVVTTVAAITVMTTATTTSMQIKLQH